jgi:monofunctional biosynthetic peptidoglycan transglycosylase
MTKLMLMEREKGADIKYHWRSLEHISDKIALAVMCAEDQYFLIHNGLDFQSIDKAMENNKKSRNIRGASTLSQQVVKNIFLWPDRTWLRKVPEVYFTLIIEALWSKERIMEVYLNVAEMGEGVFGVEAASQLYFQKSSDQLTVVESAKLAAILPSPKKFHPNQPTPYLTRRIDWIMKQMEHWQNKMTYDAEVLRKMIQD